MGSLIAILCFCYILYGPEIASANTYDVTSYGAKGDGNTDDTNAFVQAWADLCKDTSNPTLIIPSQKTFLIKCVTFNGPCSSRKLLGDITAPKSVDGWKGCDTHGYLIVFSSVHGLTINGPGKIDGQGSAWWGGLGGGGRQLDGPTCDCPSMLRFESCNGLHLSGTTHINSPKSHISLLGCHYVEIDNLNISAPGTSPNTDGIDLSWSWHVRIHDSVIQSGDDCIAISGGNYDINVTGITCGPGHGISIGSLGKDSSYTTVSKVLVQQCNLTGTQNGLRIKTVPYGRGYAKGIVFQDINLVNVGNPIIIDQHYCTSLENVDCPSPPSASAVQVSDVLYKNIHGSSASSQAVTLNCSGKLKCSGIITDNVGITGQNTFAYCNNVYGKFIDTSPHVSCTFQ